MVGVPVGRQEGQVQESAAGGAAVGRATLHPCPSHRPPPPLSPPPTTEYGAEAAHWQYKERGYGGGSAPAPALATSSLDDDQPTTAGTSAGGRGGAAREANWAKWQLSQQASRLGGRSVGGWVGLTARASRQRSSFGGCVCAAVPPPLALPSHTTVAHLPPAPPSPLPPSGG